MHISAPIPFTFRGAPAQMHVLRSDGYCWGRIVQGPQQFDVGSGDDFDYYDDPDTDAAEAYVEAAQDEANVSPAIRPI